MTGFGQAQGDLSERLAADVRMASVNSRFLEVSLRTHPRVETAELEAALRPVLSGGLARGRVQVTVELRPLVRSGTDLVLHWELASQLMEALRQRPAGLELAPLALRDLLALPGFAEGGGELALTAEEQRALLGLAGGARDALVAQREREAVALLPQISGELAEIASFRSWLAEVNEQVGAALFGRLRERLAGAAGRVRGQPGPTAPGSGDRCRSRRRLRGGAAAGGAPRALRRAARRGRAGREEDRLPPAGAAARGEHRGLEVPRGRDGGAGRRGEGRAREAARAVRESGVRRRRGAEGRRAEEQKLFGRSKVRKFGS